MNKLDRFESAAPVSRVCPTTKDDESYIDDDLRTIILITNDDIDDKDEHGQ